uniref:PDZ domain-containing protein n=1 Tax=Periophthalmus magnuspinnatus TaxID=409849 RepID=A0A3B3Z710_9GOBI
MKVTVNFGNTAVVVPCKAGWTVKDLAEQATRRYRRILEQQQGDDMIQTHHLEYSDGGILDMDDPLADLVEDREKVRKYTPLLVRSCSDSVLAQPLIPISKICLSFLKNSTVLVVIVVVFDIFCVFFRPLTKTVEFPGNRGPLGIHVVPYCSSLSGRTLGLHIRGIEATSRSKKENLFQEDECIVQINDTSLLDKTFAQSQEVFRQAMSAPVIRCEVLPAANKPRYEKSLIGNIFNSDSKDSSTKASPVVVRSRAGSQPLDPNPRPKIDLRKPETKTPEPPMIPPQEIKIQSGYGSSNRQSPVPPGGSAIPSPTPRVQSTNPVTSTLANLTNKKGGKKIKIDLKKGPEGLGFTVVTRDSTGQGVDPILVKKILQRGAAVKDGRLQPGDRILEVNGVDMTGRSQEELVAMLRSTKQGESVFLLVAREDMFLPRELKGEEASAVVLEDGRKQLMFEVPLNESGSAGLGVSLKGNKSRETGEDLGIFIKSIIHGGAAYKDGRLCVNDQLIEVNGETLVGRSNHAAMETLRRSMSSEGNARGTIQVVVLRSAKQVATNGNNYSSYSNSHLDDLDESFPPPPSPGAVAEMNLIFLCPSFSLDRAEGGAVGPTLGLVKSSSLESLQSAMEEVRQNSGLRQVPFHKPRPHMVRGRGSNMSFRQAIDKSYEGPSEDDDDFSEHSSGHETAVSTSSRNDLDIDSKKKKKTKGKKKEKKTKTKKEPVEDPDRKKKKGFGLLSHKKCCIVNILTIFFSPDSRYSEIHTGHLIPDYEDEDSDPHYARINDFRQHPSSTQLTHYRSRSPSPPTPIPGQRNPVHTSTEDLDELYAKVNKPRKPAYNDPNQADSVFGAFYHVLMLFQNIPEVVLHVIYSCLSNLAISPKPYSNPMVGVVAIVLKINGCYCYWQIAAMLPLWLWARHFTCLSPKC